MKPKQSWALPEDMQGNWAQVVCAMHPSLAENFLKEASETSYLEGHPR